MVYPLEDGPQWLLRNSPTHRLASLWEITREDGTILRFTDHDKNIVYSGDTYVSAMAPMASAREMRPVPASTNVEWVAAFDSTLVTYQDLHKGLYNNAQIWERVVNWMYPDVVGPIRQRKYFVDKVTYTDIGWTAEIMSVAHKLNRTYGRTHDKFCRHEFGKGLCIAAGGGFSFLGLETINFKTSAQTVSTVSSDWPKHLFVVGSPSITITEEWFQYGKVLWITGNNAGVTSTIREVRDTYSTWELWAQTPFEIEAGDTFYAYVGCSRRFDDCVKYGNNINFGGHPYMPGTSKAAPIQV